MARGRQAQPDQGTHEDQAQQGPVTHEPPAVFRITRVECKQCNAGREQACSNANQRKMPCQRTRNDPRIAEIEQKPFTCNPAAARWLREQPCLSGTEHDLDDTDDQYQIGR